MNGVAAIVVVGQGGKQKTGGGTEEGSFGSPVVVVLANDRSGDAADEHVATGVIAGVGGNCHDQGGRAGEGEKKASVHTSAET